MGAIPNPIDNAEVWHNFTAGGVKSPGVIAPDGVHGFERETGWDKKKGKGARGATLTLAGAPPAEGSFIIQLWRAQDFDDWDAFLPLLKYQPEKDPSERQAFDIYYPSLARLDINAVVTHKVHPERHVGRGLYIVQIDMIEWMPVPAVSIVATPSSAAADASKNPVGGQPDPISDAKQAEIAALLQKAQQSQ